MDTCCIDKSNSTELSEAINSIFRWYRDATKCYVYLPDVSRLHSNSADNSNEAWESTFRKSEWFRRGWTLQELIAPASVDFFCKEGDLLGNKASLERNICEITGIPASVLRGSPLSEFSVDERLSWAASRETFRQEDKAYSLLGIFDVNMSLIYSEGKENAFRRLKRKIDKKINGYEFQNLLKTSTESLPKLRVPFVPDPNIASRGNVRHEKTHWPETQRLVNGAGYSGTFRGRSGLKCYRCDNCHRLGDCYASSDTVSKARDRRMNSDRCVNCGSEEHWGKDCDWEDLRELKSRWA